MEPTVALTLPDAEATARLGRWLAGRLRPGDLVTLAGPTGAGKSHLARAAIQSLLAAEGRFEEVPSPSFTLVQGYETAQGELLHADLYRLADPRDLDDIGLTDALGQAICLIEWPELLALPPELPRLEIALTLAPALGTGEAAEVASGPPGLPGAAERQARPATVATPAGTADAAHDLPDGAGQQARLTVIGAQSGTAGTATADAVPDDPRQQARPITIATPSEMAAAATHDPAGDVGRQAPPALMAVPTGTADAAHDPPADPGRLARLTAIGPRWQAELRALPRALAPALRDA